MLIYGRVILATSVSDGYPAVCQARITRCNIGLAPDSSGRHPSLDPSQPVTSEATIRPMVVFGSALGADEDRPDDSARVSIGYNYMPLPPGLNDETPAKTLPVP